MASFTAKKSKIMLIVVILLYQLIIPADLCSDRRCNESPSIRHLIVASIQSSSGIMAQRNASGHVVSARGIPVSMLEWLSREYNLTFSYLPTNVTVIDGVPPVRIGLIDYVIQGKADVVLPLVPTTSRVALVDFVDPYLYIPISYLIPFGNPYANTSAVTEPFQLSVWIGIFLTVVIATFFFSLISRILRIKNFIAHNYVLGVLLDQGSYCTSPRLSIRIAAGCWCLACVVLVNSYSSVLISYLTLSNQNLLINNIEDLKARPDVFLVTDKGLSTDITLTNSESGLLKALGDKLRSYSKSRCNTTQECIKMVKSGSHVYTSVYITTIIIRDGDQLMRMREFGLITSWKRPYEADVSHCIHKAKEYTGNERISLLHLTGAFVVLLTGMSLSIITFVCEVFCAGNRR